MKTARLVQVLLATGVMWGSASPLPSQEPAPSAASLGALVVPIHTAARDPVGGEYGIWAAGRDYKVSFHDGMTFHPFDPGAEVASGSVHWKTLSARVGGRELVTRSSPIHRRTEYRYEYDWGGVVEAYEVRANGLEQTFVVSERPDARGSLRIRGRLVGGVGASERGPGHAELLLADARGRARAGYGAAVAVDAHGRRAAMTTACRGGVVELELDAGWLDAATFPVVVDPLLTNRAIETDANGFLDVDVYRDDQEQNGNLWVVYSLKTASNDTDLVVRRYPDGFAGLGATVFADLSTSWRSEEGSIAGVGGGGAGWSVAAFTRYFSTGPRVRLHVHRKDDYALSSSYLSAPFVAGTHQWRPAVGGSRSFAPGTQAVVAYQLEVASAFTNTEESQVRVMLVDAAGLSIAMPPRVIVGAPGQDQERPAVNREARGDLDDAWLVVWQQYANSAAQANWGVFGRLVKTDGTLSAQMLPFADDAPGDAQDYSPKVAGADGRYLVAFGRNDYSLTPYKISVPQASRIWTRRVDWPSTAAAGSFPWPEQRVRSDVAPRLVTTGCAFDTGSRSHWAIAVANTLNGTYVVNKLGYRGASVENVPVYTISGYTTEGGGLCYDERNDRYPLAFAADTTSTDILFGTAVTYESVQPASNYGSGCGVATLTWQGSGHVGDEFGRVEVSATANTPVFVMLALAQDQIPLGAYGMPGCDLLVGPLPGQLLASLWSSTDGAGLATYGLPIPERVGRVTLYFQAFHLAPGANALDLLATPGLRVSFGR